MVDSKLLTAVQVATITKGELKALDRASIKVLAFEQFVQLSDKAFDARKALVHLLDQQDSDFSLTGHTEERRALFFMPSSKEAGCWQTTRFDNQGEPWGDTHYTSRRAGLTEYLQEVDFRSLRCQDGPLWCDELTSDAAAALLQDSKVVNGVGAALTLYHGTQGVFTKFSSNPRGLFFTENRADAEPFSRIRKGEPVIKAVHLAINRPWTMIRYSDDTPYNVQVDQSIATLKAKGFDGIHCPDDKVWIAFEPEQVFDAEESMLLDGKTDHESFDDSTNQDGELVTEQDAPHG